MVVYEVKDTSNAAAVSLPPKQRRRDVIPAYPVNEIRTIDQLLYVKEWGRERKRREREMLPLDEDGLSRIRKLTERVNENLEACGILIHLVLIEDENGFALDVYDCSSGDMCQVIHDIEVGLDELPKLLVRLQMEAGIMFDTVL